jgi:hypothetical protein
VDWGSSFVATVVSTAVSLAGGLLSPLSLAPADDGSVWFSQNYAGLLQRLDPSGEVETVVKAPGDLEVAAVSTSGGTVWYSVTGAGHTIGRLHERSADGTDTVVADLYAHERDENPDGAFRYGFTDLPRGCRVPRSTPRSSYTGPRETHPVASVHAFGATYVADAAANAVLAVSDPGVVTTLAAFPPVETTMTAAYAEENGFPACTVGTPYAAEAVPTDVEAGPYGSLYVTTLPGGPEQADGEPAGALWRVLPLTGARQLVTGGLDTPVGIAVADTGDVYVAELQANRVVRIAVGTSTPEVVARQTFPGDLEWDGDGLLASVDVLSGTSGQDPPLGEIVRIRP